jgi:two-component system, OmpR family, sensor histidine kinase BaeS
MNHLPIKLKMGVTQRLFFCILGAAALTLLCILLIMQWSITRGFLQYLDVMERSRSERLASTLEQVYTEHGGWKVLQDDPKLLMERLLGGPQPQPPPKRGADFGPHPNPPPYPRPPPHPGPMEMPFVVLDADRKPIFGGSLGHDEVAFKPIVVGGATVGYAGLRSPPKAFLDPPELHFLARQKWVLLVAGMGLVLLVMAFSILLSRRLVKPIKAMAAATRDLSSGNYGVRIPVSSSDELGTLARSFNLMAMALKQNEDARRQWIADISHELRTPLTVLRAEIEALMEGIRETTPDAIRSLHVEMLRLHRLVDDLYQLALSDLGALTYRKEELDLTEVLDDAVTRFTGDFVSKDIAVRLNLPKGPESEIYGDRERLHQLFAHILDNCLKYTDVGGVLEVSLSHSDDRVVITFEDSYPGVAVDEMDRLFDRLYRVEGSRSRASGGAGLGLAISKSIVEGHEGMITARPSTLGGIAVEITLPAGDHDEA